MGSTSVCFAFTVEVGKNSGAVGGVGVRSCVADKTCTVHHRVLCKVVVTVTVGVIGRARCSGERAAGTQPCVAVWIADPVGDWGIGIEDFADCRIALCCLAAKRVARNDDLLHVGKHTSIVKVLDKLIEDIVGRNGSRVPRVLIVASSRPLGARPHQGIAGRATTGLEARSPGIAGGSVVAIGKKRSQDRYGAEVDIWIGGDLGQCAEHLARISKRNGGED